MNDANDWFENEVRSFEDLFPRHELLGTLARLELAKRFCKRENLGVELERAEAAMAAMVELMVVREVSL